MVDSGKALDADVIIIGLGCVGISTAFQCTKQGLKVIGLERHADTGSIGTASYGHTRIWRTVHDDVRYNEMQREALETWREIEQRTGKKILHKTGMLMVLHPESEIYKYVVKVGGGETLTNAEMKKRYPALIAMPDDFVGYLAENAGVVKAREGLMATKKLSLE